MSVSVSFYNHRHHTEMHIQSRTCVWRQKFARMTCTHNPSHSGEKVIHSLSPLLRSCLKLMRHSLLLVTQLVCCTQATRLCNATPENVDARFKIFESAALITCCATFFGAKNLHTRARALSQTSLERAAFQKRVTFRECITLCALKARAPACNSISSFTSAFDFIKC